MDADIAERELIFILKHTEVRVMAMGFCYSARNRCGESSRHPFEASYIILKYVVEYLNISRFVPHHNIPIYFMI